MRGKYLIDTLKNTERRIGVTLVCCFSRKIFIPFFFKALEQMDLPREKIHLLVYDNTDNEELANELIPVLKPLNLRYQSIRLYKSYLKPKYKVSGTEQPKFSESKISNIFEMWKDLATKIHTKTFFQLEDDTVAPPDAYKRLFATLSSRGACAMVTGISTGRHVNPYHKTKLGLYKVKVCPRGSCKKIIERMSFDPETKGIVSVMACGVYCFAATTIYFFSGLKGFNPAKWKIPYWALDVWFTRNMREMGFNLYADFDVWCTHLHAAGNRINAFGKDQAVQKVDIWLPEYENYALDVEVNPAENKRKFKPADTWEI